MVDVGVLKKLLEEQEVKIQNLEKKVVAAGRQAEAAEQYSRQDCLIFRGKVDVRPNMSLRDEVRRLIAFHTGVTFPEWCINTVHWLGGGKGLIVRFNNKAVRDSIYYNRIPKDVSKRGLFVHESLTSTKMELVNRCARLRRDGKIMSYYTQGGNVFVRKTRQTPNLLVTPEMTDENILLKLSQQPNTYREAAARPTSAAHPTTLSKPAGHVDVSHPAQPTQPSAGDKPVAISKTAQPAAATPVTQPPAGPTTSQSQPKPAVTELAPPAVVEQPVQLAQRELTKAGQPDVDGRLSLWLGSSQPSWLSLGLWQDQSKGVM